MLAASMAWPIGMPSIIHTKNNASMTEAAKLIALSDVFLPACAEQAAQPPARADDNGKHEYAEAGVDVVERDAQDHGLPPPEKADVVHDGRQGGEEDETQGRGDRNRHHAPPAPREFQVQDV